MYRVCRIENIHDWLDNESRWNSLAGVSPFLQWAWQATWWNHFGSAFVPYFLLVCDRDQRPCGLVPWMMPKERRRRLRFVASGSACSDGLSILCHPSQAEGIGKAVADWLVDQATDDDLWHELDLEGVLHGDPAMSSLVQRLGDRGVWCQSESRVSRWYLPTSGSLPDYLAQFGKTRRRQFRQHLSRLNEPGELTCSVASAQPDMAVALKGLIDLHQQRWNAVGKPGSYADPLLRQFIQQAAELFLFRDRLRLVSLKHQDQLIAAQLQFVANDSSLAIYSSGMALQHADLEPGRVIDANTIDFAFANQLPGIDYLRGDEPYKANLHAQPTPVVSIKAFSKHRFGRLEQRMYQSKFEVKQWLRRRRGTELIQVLRGLQPPKATTSPLPPVITPTLPDSPLNRVDRGES